MPTEEEGLTFFVLEKHKYLQLQLFTLCLCFIMALLAIMNQTFSHSPQNERCWSPLQCPGNCMGHCS